MTMNVIWKVLVIFLLINESIAGELPSTLESYSRKGVEIQEYIFNSTRVYLIDSRDKCCDLGATVYNTEGEVFCRYIGIAGAWEEACKGFDESSEHVKTIRAKEGT
jgi:hypothetical protein